MVTERTQNHVSSDWRFISERSGGQLQRFVKHFFWSQWGLLMTRFTVILANKNFSKFPISRTHEEKIHRKFIHESTFMEISFSDAAPQRTSQNDVQKSVDYFPGTNKGRTVPNYQQYEDSSSSTQIISQNPCLQYCSNCSPKFTCTNSVFS